MKKLPSLFVIAFIVLPQVLHAQVMMVSANRPGPTSSRTRLPDGDSVYGVFVGRTPCQELMKEMNAERKGCIKRKIGLTLYQDPVTRKPTSYELRGMGKWTGKGTWRSVQGAPHDPRATVFEIRLDSNTFLYLLKGDDNVLFVLDRNRNFLTGNANFSYTLNRARN